MTSPLIVVFGVTGEVGAMTATALCNSYRVQGVTRDPTSTRARTLAKGGVEIRMLENHGDQATLDAILSGAHGCFIATNSDNAKADGFQREVAQGRAIADACFRARINHVVYCTQLSPVKTIGVQARHMDAKAEIELYMKDHSFPITSIIVPHLYSALLMQPLKPKRVSQECYEISIPMGHTPLNLIGADDVGEIVRQVFLDGKRYANKTLAITGDKLTVGEIAATLSQFIRPRFVKDAQVTIEQFRSQGFPGVDDMCNMYTYFQRVDQKHSLDLTKRLNPATKSFAQWIHQNIDYVAQELDQ